MTSLRARAGLGALGSVGLIALGAASPVGAIPAPVEGCGAEPEGADLTRSGDVCQVSYTTPGEYEWTVPSGLTSIHAVVTGAGGGAEVRRGNWGYAGSGGDVVYHDLSGVGAGAVVDLEVGQPGASAFDSSAGGATSLGGVGAGGGAAGGFMLQYCVVGGSYSTYVGNGAGAGGAPGPDESDCATSTAPGIMLGSDDDIFDAESLALFAGYVGTHGAGGRVINQSTVAPTTAAIDVIPAGAIATTGTGHGADVFYIDGAITSEPTGDSGSVIIRYPAAAAPTPAPTPTPTSTPTQTPVPTLAETGADMGPLAALAVTLLGLGGLGVLVRRRATATTTAKN